MSKLLSYHQKNMFNRSKKTKMLPSNDTLTVNHVIIIFLGIKRLRGITHLIFNELIKLLLKAHHGFQGLLVLNDVFSKLSKKVSGIFGSFVGGVYQSRK